MIRKIWREFIPDKTKEKLLEMRRGGVRKKIIKYYKNTNDIEKREIIDYLETHPLEMFNYNFREKYVNKDNEIFKDKETGLYYILYQQKKMYFKRSMNIQDINKYYNDICIEQDKKSPHLYLTEEFKKFHGRVIFDIGAAEGNFALSIIDQVDKIYVFECDEEWIEALKLTFKPYKNKVHIVKRYVSDKNSDYEVTLDCFCKKKNIANIDLIKMDIEGAEIRALKGAKNCLKKNSDAKILICAYHSKNAEREIKNILKGYKIIPRRGYMVIFFDLFDQLMLRKPYLRRGVLQAEKNK